MTIPKLYLIHFFYIPVAILYMLFNSGDANTNTLFIGIICSFSGLIYLLNISIYYLTLKLSFGKKLLSALMPTILTGLFFNSANDMIGGFDIGPNNPTIWVTFFNTAINLGIYYYLESMGQSKE